MIVKHPDSDNALRSLWRLISSIRSRFSNCVHQQHDVIALLYISSLIISPRVVYNGNQLLEEIRNTVNMSPRNFVCLVRTTAPSKFPGRMRVLQNQAIDLLRDSCYTVVYHPSYEFLNHAKFAVYYQICYSENIVYHGKYYGSTNLTVAGLAYRRGTRIVGNYEEYTVAGLRPKFILSKGDEFYLNEALELIIHKASLYTDPNYLRKYLLSHLTYMERVLHHSRRVVSGTTLGELYCAYVDLMVAHNQTYALLDEVPGKKLTEELEIKLMRIKLPINTFELEMLMPVDEKHGEMLAKDLGLGYEDTRRLVKEHIDVVEKAYELIKDSYLVVLGEVKNYFDSKERKFIEFIESNNTHHKSSLAKAVEIARRRKKV